MKNKKRKAKKINIPAATGVIEIRYIIKEDIPDIVEFAAKHAHEIPSWGEIDRDILTNSLNTMLLVSTYFVKGVFLDGELVGGMIGEISPTWFNARFESNGRTIYLDRRVRGKGIAQQLYNQFDKWASNYLQVSHGGLQTTSGVDITPLVTKLGYVKTGMTFRKVY